MTQTEKMTVAEFEQRLQTGEFFLPGTGEISDDPRLQEFLKENPDSAALARDLAYIAKAAADLLQPDHDLEPSDNLWDRILHKMDPALDGANDTKAVE